MIFDTHAHYDDEQFDADRDELLASLPGQGVLAVMNVGASMAGAKASVALARASLLAKEKYPPEAPYLRAAEYPKMMAAVGIHPDHAKELNEEEFEVLKELVAANVLEVSAIGEIGLDYYWDASDRETQKYWFWQQLELACERQLPVVIHSREAAEDTLRILQKAYKKSGETLTGVIHCFSYGVEMAREYLNMGFYIGVGGVSTFKNGRKLKEVIAEVPLERILLETDSPYLAPEPFRGKRNSSEKLEYVVKAIADIKGVTEEEVKQATWKNAWKLFGVKV